MEPVDGICSKFNNLHRTILYHPAIFKPEAYYYYSQSATTTLAAFENRHRAQLLPEYDPKLFRDDTIFKKFKRKLVPWTYEQYIESMDSPKKRVFYQMVYNDMCRGRRISSVVTPFTKLEKMSTSKYKAPRLIQGRHPTFNLAYGRYIKPLEKSLKIDRHFGKGNYDDIGKKVHYFSKKYKYYTEGDHTTFDSHVTREMLQLCHRFYSRCYKQNRELHKLCK
uniref:RNA-dependent RNA polymerase n=1 Tax=Crane fly tombus-like virus 1 TaxID=2499248 RepID=A0A3S9W0J8_9TOMB|nr:RNA-dependent RNA polymerase [Crane fly tombus-like virus 1]